MSNTNKGKELYTPEELIWATQLAYCNFSIKEKSDIGRSVQEIISERGPEIYYNYDPDSTPSGDEKTMKEATEKFIEDVANGNICKGWKIVSVYDREDKEGICHFKVGIIV